MIRFCRECMQLAQACNCPASIRPHSEDLIDPRPGIDRHASEIRMRILRHVLDPNEWAAAVELAKERAWSEGAKVYGNASYAKDDAALKYEGVCELADWIFYLHIPCEREEQQP